MRLADRIDARSNQVATVVVTFGGRTEISGRTETSGGRGRKWGAPVRRDVWWWREGGLVTVQRSIAIHTLQIEATRAQFACSLTVASATKVLHIWLERKCRIAVIFLCRRPKAQQLSGKPL